MSFIFLYLIILGADVKKIDETTFEIVYQITGYNNIKVVVSPGDKSLSVAKQPWGQPLLIRQQ
ncbi:hypothetical protein [Sphingobacterium nematocida]|uniref:hypothetical protein n=1 Tax=Sphingobacterium nematocida TaxID=1513896 RepID=UPI0009A8D3CD|nr:hypothetical protein [Sphingobacterium nematocida]